MTNLANQVARFVIEIFFTAKRPLTLVYLDSPAPSFSTRRHSQRDLTVSIPCRAISRRPPRSRSLPPTAIFAQGRGPYPLDGGHAHEAVSCMAVEAEIRTLADGPARRAGLADRSGT
ncbi:MAG: hypothetical protein ACJA1L_000908 [Paracoccaceae bacterium]|jgi:hypothetical protein